MTKEQIGGIVRAVLAAGITWAAAKGLIPVADYGELIAAASTLAIAAWSVSSKKKAE